MSSPAHQTELPLNPPVLRTAPYQKSSRTSREQAARVRPKAGTQRARVLVYLHSSSTGLTMHQISDALRIPLSSVCARLSELREGGWAKDTDETRETPYGGTAAVWITT